jgi:hypothetical protein
MAALTSRSIGKVIAGWMTGDMAVSNILNNRSWQAIRINRKSQ